MFKLFSRKAKPSPIVSDSLEVSFVKEMQKILGKQATFSYVGNSPRVVISEKTHVSSDLAKRIHEVFEICKLRGHDTSKFIVEKVMPVKSNNRNEFVRVKMYPGGTEEDRAKEPWYNRGDPNETASEYWHLYWNVIESSGENGPGVPSHYCSFKYAIERFNTVEPDSILVLL